MLAALSAATLLFVVRAGAAGRPTFNRDVRPILAAHCLACHGTDAHKREANLRLDERASAVDQVQAIVVGKAADSPLIERVLSEDPGEQMPPPKSKKGRLTAAEIDVLRRWIDAGAVFEPHWAYVKPVRPPVPPVRDARWSHNPIDAFVAAGHDAQHLRPQPEADRRTLIRRLSFDLRGLPPTPAEVDAFLADRRRDAYEQLVDRLLAAPQYGERMAQYWLDVVRYADTCGYHSDNERHVWMYRDYVIRAFNENRPFDQFTREQLAGDLLPKPSGAQRIASGYNRLLQTTEEGGAQPKEYTAKFAADRVRNTATAWLGVTLGCAQCHDHKYDPFSTRDFYRFSAFFADIKELPVGRQPATGFPTPAQAAAMARLQAEMAPLEQSLERDRPKFEAALAAWEKRLKASPPPPEKAKLPKEIAEILAAEPSRRNADQKRQLGRYFRGIAPEWAAIDAKLAPLEKRKAALEMEVPSTLLTEAVAPRETRILPRGNWMDDSGPVVTPAIPAVFGTIEAGGRRLTRRDLAEWLVAPDNPLVARAFVNRLWMLLFGQALARPTDELGTQGALPTHPELLDWLAVEFRQSGWDIKHMVRLIVRSETYRQSSSARPDLVQADPTNQYLARQGSFRVDAEAVRDLALAASGLLSPRIGGPSTKPYQPAGYWDFLNFPKRQWVADVGPDQYRRGLYTFWQRTLLHPSLLAFDACTREESTAERARSNTPLQSLALLNDPTYVEAARVLAARAVREGGPEVAGRLAFLFRALLQREPSPAESRLLVDLYRSHLEQYRADRKSAEALMHVGQTPPPADAMRAETAAWTSVARAVLNLHETITRD
jgi:hypothetical protein